MRLDVNDPAALALGYVENAVGVDLKKYPSYVAWQGQIARIACSCRAFPA
jgi:hypothetical protein